MVIDVDATTSALVRDSMEPGACVLLTFDTCEEGVAAAVEWPPDALILCADLPGGFGACRRLKKDTATRDIPLVLVSALSTDAQLDEHQRLPTRADVYLKKPLDPARVAFVLAELLSRQSGLEDLDVELADVPELPPEPPPAPELPVDDVHAFDAAPITDPERAATPDRLSETTRAYSELVQDHLALTARLEATTGALARAEEDKTALARQVADLTARLAQTESLQAATQARLTAFGEELERERAARAHAEAWQVEVRRLSALNADLTESLEAIGESLRAAVEIVARHAELSGARPPAETMQLVPLDELE